MELLRATKLEISQRCHSSDDDWLSDGGYKADEMLWKFPREK